MGIAQIRNTPLRRMLVVAAAPFVFAAVVTLSAIIGFCDGLSDLQTVVVRAWRGSATSGGKRMTKARAPAQIIGNDLVCQLVFEGYVIVPANPTEAILEMMRKIADGPARTLEEYWSSMVGAASGECAVVEDKRA